MKAILTRSSKKDTSKDSDRDSFTGSFSVPADQSDWTELLTKGQLKKKTIHDIFKFGSGSEVRKRQFIMFRTIWPLCEPSEAFEGYLNEYGLVKFWEQANTILSGSNEFSKYLELIESPINLSTMSENDTEWAGSWMAILQWQRKCSRKHVGEVDDENIVNAALVLFLEALKDLAQHSICEWTMKRVYLEAHFRSGHFKAINDGVLWVRMTKRILGFLEVKKAMRTHPHAEKIQMQESAEMIAYIMNSNDQAEIFNKKRLLISQDGDSAYVTFGAASNGYVGYLRTGANDMDPFLTMQCHGPFKLGKREHVRKLAQIVLSILLLADEATKSFA